MSLVAVQSLVDDLVRDTDGVISSVQRDAAIANAVERYSADAPRTVVVDATSPGGQRIDLPAGFTDTSRLIGIEFPVGDIPATLLDRSDISVYDSPTERQIELPVFTNPGDTLRLRYTGAHILDAATDTVPAAHRHALASLAGAFLCGQLAAHYSNESAPTINADTVDHNNKSNRWRTRMRDLLADYKAVIGVAPTERERAASVDVELRRNNTLGRRRMFHPPTGWTQ